MATGKPLVTYPLRHSYWIVSSTSKAVCSGLALWRALLMTGGLVQNPKNWRTILLKKTLRNWWVKCEVPSNLDHIVLNTQYCYFYITNISEAIKIGAYIEIVNLGNCIMYCHSMFDRSASAYQLHSLLLRIYFNIGTIILWS